MPSDEYKLARGQKPKVVRCGNHWAVDWYSAIGSDFPVWWCFKNREDAVTHALKVFAAHQKQLARLGGLKKKRNAL